MNLLPSICCLLFLWHSVAAADSSYRLQNVDLSNIEYKLTISAITKDSFDGDVTITFTPAKATKTLQLHSDGLQLPSSFTLDKATVVQVTGPDANTNILTLSWTDDILPNQPHTLWAQYTGTVVNGEMYGFYRSTYGEGDDVQELFATQFEPTYARRLLPCFDEPAYKATFEVTVEHDSKFTALSNTAVKTTKKSMSNLKETTTTTEFEKTPVMSPYLLALVVSEFKSSSTSKDATTAVWTSEDKAKYTATAAAVTPKLIKFLGDFVQLPYETLGIAKSDQVAIPDFAAGAMENWGLITYRESDLLDEADETTAAGKQKVATVVCHELAHQWFGDYVTLNWWGETWLNEGFATYFEFHVADLLQDDYDLDKQFVVKTVQPVLLADSVSSVQALYTPPEQVNSLVQINNKFGDISYDKGGSVIRMVQHVLGLDAFKTVLNAYLTGHKNGNVGHDHLITAIGADGEKFRGWFEQSGFPLVTLTKNESGYFLTQQHYNNDKSKRTWSVPITYTTSKSLEPSAVQWLEDSEGTLEIKDDDDSLDWVVLNYQQGGYYRVNYDKAVWTAIAKALADKPEQMDELNRAQLIDDAFNLANTKHVTYETAFSLMKYLKKETSYYAWTSTFNAITALLKKVETDSLASSIKSEMLSLMSEVIAIPTATNAEIEGSHTDKLKTVDVLSKACSFGHSGCVKFAQQVLTDYLKDKNINNDFRAFGLCAAIANSKNAKQDWDNLWAQFLKFETSHEKDDLLAALACSQDADILSAYLLKTIDAESGIRKQDGKIVIRAVIKSGPMGVQAALKFMQDKGKDLIEYYKGMNALGDLVLGLSQVVSNAADLKTLRDYISSNKDVEEVKEVTDQCQEVMISNENWWKDNKDLLLKLFPKEGPGAANTASLTFGLLAAAVVFVLRM